MAAAAMDEETLMLKDQRETPAPRTHRIAFMCAAAFGVAGLAAYFALKGPAMAAFQGSRTTALWTMTPPTENTSCRIQVFAQPDFEGVVHNLKKGTPEYERMRVQNELHDVGPIGSLKVEGNCTAVLCDREHPTHWPCFFRPGAYAGMEELTKQCPNAVFTRSLGIHCGAPSDTEVDTMLVESGFGLNDSDVCHAPMKSMPWTATDQTVAHAWFHQYFNVYVINMNEATDQWGRVRDELERQNIWNSIRSLSPDVRKPTELFAANLSGILDKNGLALSGVIGALGHFVAWKMAANADKPYAIVLQDDAHIVDNFVREVWDLVMNRVPAGWDYVSLFDEKPFGTCVGAGLLRLAKAPAPCTSPASGTRAFLYRKDALVRMLPVFGKRVSAETDAACSSINNILYGGTDLFTMYSVDTDHALVLP